MNELYNQKYFENYNFNSDVVNYITSSEIREYFDKLARKIVDEFNPKTVLDCGCAMGYLVLALRRLGVEAFGLDISEYAINNVESEVKPFCFNGSITTKLSKELPGRFDLVVCNQVLNCMDYDDVAVALENMSQVSDNILIGESDIFYDNIESYIKFREYFAGLLAKHSMFRKPHNDFNFDGGYLTLYCKLENMAEVIKAYEKDIVLIKNQNKKLSYENNELEDKLVNYSEECVFLTGLVEKIDDLKKDNESLKGQLIYYNDTVNSLLWKCVSPVRSFFGKIKRKCKLVKKGIDSIFKIGFKATWNKFKKRISNFRDYSLYMKNNKPTDEELNFQKNYAFDKKVVFSIVVPLYNTNIEFLKEMIDSVVSQTYSGWELCLADGSDSEHVDVEKCCREYVAKDSRIVYKKLENNMGISENTNAAIRMAQGDYIALLDHDDLLHPSALYECMKVMEKQYADVIYTDEMIFKGKLDNVTSIHFKPDFSPDTLLGHNYICHFLVYSRELQNKVGDFSDECGGSQDYDMVLRLSEHARNIVHIPKVLYFWRSHDLSVASDVSVKPYCMESAKKAISNHLKRIGREATVTDSSVLSTYKINYKIIDNPKVSILIPNKDNILYLDRCVKSILEKSTYSNFEIIIIENNSVESKTEDFYKVLERKDPRIKIVHYDGEFNYSKINNFGATFATGEYLLLLNNDIEIISANWIEEMLMFAQRDDVGVVGAKLCYEDDTVQHAGVIIGIGGVAGHAHKHLHRDSEGYVHRMSIAQNLSAVTAACLMTRRDVWEQMHGLDETFKVAFNDVDFCLRVRQAGYLIVFTPYAELYHYESKSRGYEDTPEKVFRFSNESKAMKERWHDILEKGDPYYNPNFSLESEDFQIKTEKID